MIRDRPKRFTTQIHQHEELIVTVIHHLVTLHDAEALHVPICRVERFDDYPTLKRYTTAVQCANKATEFAIGPISCSLSADALHLERTFSGG